MACFLVSAAEAAVASAVEKKLEKDEKQQKENKGEERQEIKISLARKIKWLKNLLLGGSVLLAFEHLWHGEIVAWFPFLTAMSDPADTAEMLHEMATVGVAMAVLITVTWLIMCKAADVIVKKDNEAVEKVTA